MTDRADPPAGPLADLTVIDLTIAYSGPMCTLYLAGLGARVIKVENPAGGDVSRGYPPFLGAGGIKFKQDQPDDMALSFINRCRSKLSVTLNLRHELGRNVLRDLVRQADILVENYSPGVMERLGLGYESLKEINKGLIYCAISGFGSEVRGDGARAMDIMIQARSGIMAVTGAPGDPPWRQGVPIGDLVGPLFANIGILSAIHQRRTTGEGRYVDISLLDGLTSFVAGEHFDLFQSRGLPIRTGNAQPRSMPFGVFPTQDGFVAIAAPFDNMAHTLFRLMGRPDMVTDPRYATWDERVAHRADLEQLISAWARGFAKQDLVDLLNPGGVPASVVQEPPAAVHDPMVVNRQAVVPLRHPIHEPQEEVMGTGLPIRFQGQDCGLHEPAPFLGQHNDLVLRQFLAYSDEYVHKLKAAGAI